MLLTKQKWRAEAYFDFIGPLIVPVGAHASAKLEQTFHDAIFVSVLHFNSQLRRESILERSCSYRAEVEPLLKTMSRVGKPCLWHLSITNHMTN